MKTLVGAADPQSSLPRIMVVDSTKEQRVAWRGAMANSNVQHHFCQPLPARHRVTDGNDRFPLAGVVINRDPAGLFAEPHEVTRFLNLLKKHRGFVPVVITSLGIGPFGMILDTLVELQLPVFEPTSPSDYDVFVRECERRLS